MDDVSICNLALSRIGVSMEISSLTTERTNEAKALRRVYDVTRDKVLSAAPWPFARTIIPLALTGDKPARWAYRYAYPNNCIRVRALIPSSVATSGIPDDSLREYLRRNKIPFQREMLPDGETMTLVTDLSDASAVVTIRVKNSEIFDASFVSAFAWALAAEIALPLAKTVDHSRNAAAQYAAAINEALAESWNEETPDRKPDSEFVLARL